jgi:hypothetical protein
MLRQARSNWFVPGRLADLGLIALAAWLLSRLMPLVTSLEVGKFQAALAPLSSAIADPRSFNGWQAFAETLSWAASGLVANPWCVRETGVCGHRDRRPFAPLVAQIPSLTGN